MDHRIVFLNYKRYLVGTLLTVYKRYGILSSAFFRIWWKFSMKIIFYLPVTPKSQSLLLSWNFIVCTNVSFIAQILSFREFREN